MICLHVISSEEICDIDNVASDEEVNDHDTEIITEKDGDLDLSDQDDIMIQSLSINVIYIHVKLI